MVVRDERPTKAQLVILALLVAAAFGFGFAAGSGWAGSQGSATEQQLRDDLAAAREQLGAAQEASLETDRRIRDSIATGNEIADTIGRLQTGQREIDAIFELIVADVERLAGQLRDLLEAAESEDSSTEP